MNNTACYIPILKAKEGEIAALESLRPDIRPLLMPLLEIPAIPYDYKSNRPSKTLHDHVISLPDRIVKCGFSGRMYFHLAWFDENGNTHELATEADALLQKCTAIGLSVIPVLSRKSSDQYVRAAASYSTRKNVGMCIRLRLSDFDEEVDLDSDIELLLKQLGVDDATEIDLIVDLGDLGSESSRALHVARSIFAILPRKLQNDWRRLVLVASSFPIDLSDVDRDETVLIPRHEWNLWKALQRKPNGLPRKDLIFGDYAISNPISKELDPTKMRMSANIRYTVDDSWLVMKGRSVREHGFSQYFELSEALVKRKEYQGRNFSWGDAFIDDCAEAMKGPGNATTWRKVGVNHHLTFVTKQLSSLAHEL
jgi:hypothetical protein